MYGWKGIDACMAFIAKQMPIKPHITKEFEEAYAEIEKINPHIKFQVPIVINEEIHSFEFEKNAEIVFGQFDIPEPKQRIKVEKIPDLVIVPLLGIDEKGYRVGYGGGFYDKYLSTLPSNVLKVGLSFWDCIDRIDDIDEFDIPLDLVITPSKIVEFGYY